MFMTKTVLKNLMTRYATRLHPFRKREPLRGTRGDLEIDMEKCTFCGLCRLRCPSQCITIGRQEKTWQLDPFACVYCGVCVDVCPTRCLSQAEAYRPPRAEKDFVFHLLQEKAGETRPGT